MSLGQGSINLTRKAQPGPEMDIFLIGGQSNAVGQGTAAQSPTPTAKTLFQYYNNTLSEIITDPVGNAATGSAWPSFGTTYYNQTGRKICFVPTAANGSAQTQIADNGNGNWSDTGTLWQASVNALNAAISAVTAAGYTPVFKGVLWCQGENDAKAINNATLTQAEYIAALNAMIVKYRNIYGSQMPFYIFRTGTNTSQVDTGYASIRDAQVIAAGQSPLNTKVVWYNAINYPARGLMKDTVHFTQDGYNEMGRLAAQEILNFDNYGWQQQGLTALYYMLGKVGIGEAIPTSSLHIKAVNETFPFYQQTDRAGLSIAKLENTNTSSSAGTGTRHYNNAGLGSQILQYSNGSIFGASNLFVLHALLGPMRVGSNVGNFEIYTNSVGPNVNAIKAVFLPNGNVIIGSDATALGDNGAKLQVEGDITTSQPSANGKGKWKLGKKIAGAVVLDGANYIEIEIDGVIYKLALAV